MKPNPCLDKKCLNKCSTITEEERMVIFVRYWNELDHNRKRDYLLSCMSMQDVKRNYVSHVNNHSCTYSYSVAIDNVLIKVCRKCILNTLNISEKLLRYTRDNKSDLFSIKPDNRGRQPRKNKTPLIQMEYVDKFIEKLPAVPSHYCKNSSNKKYSRFCTCMYRQKYF